MRPEFWSRHRSWLPPLFIAAAIVVALALAAVAVKLFVPTSPSTSAAISSASSSARPSQVAAPQDSTSVSPTDAGCTTWSISNPDTHNWVTDGVPEIKDATTDADAKAAAQTWLDKLKLDDRSLVAAAQLVLDQNVDRTTLSNGTCASQAAVDLVSSIRSTLGTAIVTPATAPKTSFNTAIEGSKVVSYPQGLSGDRTAIKVEMESPSGSGVKTFYVLSRCGNGETEGQTPFPQSNQPSPDQTSTPSPSCGCQTPAPTPTPSETASTPSPTPTPTPKPTPPPAPKPSPGAPTISVEKMNDQPVCTTTPNIRIYYTVWPGDKATITLSTGPGHASQIKWEKITGSSYVTFDYRAPCDASATQDTVKVTITDPAAGQAQDSKTFNILQGGPPN